MTAINEKGRYTCVGITVLLGACCYSLKYDFLFIYMSLSFQSLPIDELSSDEQKILRMYRNYCMSTFCFTLNINHLVVEVKCRYNVQITRI
jgi:hypothetical protein